MGPFIKVIYDRIRLVSPHFLQRDHRLFNFLSQLSHLRRRVGTCSPSERSRDTKAQALFKSLWGQGMVWMGALPSTRRQEKNPWQVGDYYMKEWDGRSTCSPS